MKMPRTKGAKNKEKSLDFYIGKVKELGGKMPPIAAAEKAVATVKKVKAKFTLDKPRQVEKETEKTPGVPLDGTVIRCGNPVCNKILDKEYSKCPHCGVNLSWQ